MIPVRVRLRGTSRFLPGPALFFAACALVLTACERKTREDRADQVPATRSAPPADPMHVRVVWTEDPARHAIISWTSLGGEGPHAVGFDTVARQARLEDYARMETATHGGPITLRADDREEGAPSGHHSHHVELFNLTPSTTYWFTVSSAGRPSREFRFVTAPQDDRPFSLLSGGDSRLGGPKPRYAGRTPHVERRAMNRLIARLVEENPGLLALAHGGDWCTTADWRHLYWWFQDHEMSTSPSGRILPIIPTRGNHDTEIGYQENFWLGDVTARHGFGYFYATPLGSTLRLYTLNSEISMAGDQLEWLRESLEEDQPSPLWLLAQYHRPAWPAVKDFGREEFAVVRKYWVPEFEKHRFDLVLESDGHVLKRTVPILRGKAHPEGVVYVGEGGMGVPQRVPDTSRWYLRKPGMARAAHHLWMLHVSADSLAYQALGMDGDILDRGALRPRERRKP